MIKTIIIISILLILIYLGSQFSWLNYTSTISKEIFSKASSKKTKVDFTELESLPEIVQKYFHLVLKEDSLIINRAYISQNGGFRIDSNKEEYLKTEAQQFFSASPRDFTWHAKISMAPALFVNVFDSYVDSKAAMKVKLLSLYTMVDEHGKSELDQGALQRFFAEAVWFPTSLLPSQGVEWKAIDNNTAKATLKDGETTVSLEFTFNDKGEITTIYSPARFKEVDGKYVATPWICRLSDYAERDGYKIPLKGEVAWIVDNKELTYYKLDIKDVKYN